MALRRMLALMEALILALLVEDWQKVVDYIKLGLRYSTARRSYSK